jgi:hypothetical protein
VNALRAALIITLAALLAGAGWWARGIVAQRDAAQAAAAQAQALRTLADAATAASEQARQAEQAAAGRINEVAIHAHAQTQAARRDAAAADAVAGRLREHLARLAATASPLASDPSAAPGGPPAAGTGLVLAKLLGRADDRAGELASHADQARIAGLACERAYDEVRAALAAAHPAPRTPPDALAGWPPAP